ncbi:hypothetical protein BS50DRAFT_141029 [Corynespora cassiicola Philippines]|uniref:Nucleoporin Nup54 alpha-helical domain-containing protein n=1 Tax=Corynespora cassiicola Philippines TaxID=1448308 RepID=A0A2T2N9V4_CORCC|nr:hypothetical protein BS50DRAFT_141029 [Corynespora cassiicola Philippines]
MTGFGRSNSLSINTGGSLFGNNTSQGQQSAGLFGSTPQPQTGGLFGAASASTSQPPQTGSLFGGQSQTSQPQSAGLFGNLSKPATATPAAGGLFGSSTAQQQPQPQPQQQAGSLFGGPLAGNAQNQNQNQAQAQKPSLFGSSTQQQQQTTPSLFGNANAQQTQAATPSLFGSTQQTQPQQQSNSLFGGMNAQNKPFALGGASTGPNLGATAQPLQVQSVDSLKGTTRFSDLSPEFQQQIQQIDDAIQGRINNANKTRETLPRHGEEVATVAPDVAYIEQFLSTVELGLDNDSANIASLKEVVKKDAEDAMLSFRAITNLSLPKQFQYGNRSNLNASTAKTQASADDSDDPNKPIDMIGYFNKRTDDIDRTLDLYQRQIREIEAHLRTMEAGTVEKAQQLTGNRSRPQDQRRELVEALKAIEGAILDSAKRVGQVRDEVTKHTMGNVGATLL